MTDSSLVTYELDGHVAVLRIDDGKANAISHALADQLQDALSQAEANGVSAVAIVGRDGRFSAGFDLKTMQAGPDEARDLLRVGAELALRLFMFPTPVVLGVTGHALAMGAILLMAGDVRIGADGPFKIGLNEVSIGMPVPLFAIDLAQESLARQHLNAAMNLAQIYDPAGAVRAGFLDEVVAGESVVPTAIERAQLLGDGLRRGAFKLTRENVRLDAADRLRRHLITDLETFTVEGI